MVLHVPIGLPGSGKSTWARFWCRGTYIVSSDAIRREMSGGEYRYDKGRNGIVFEDFYRRIERHLVFDGDVVADATNLRVQYRRPLWEIAERTGSTLSYVVFKNVAQAVLRNAERVPPRKVPDDQMMTFIARYEQMLTDITSEPYHHIVYIEDIS